MASALQPARTFRSAALATLLAVSLATPVVAKTAPKQDVDAAVEAQLAQVFSEIARSRFDLALGHVDALLKVRPNFRLAHLIRGDLLLARARPLTSMGDFPYAPADRVEDLREEAVARLKAYRERPAENMLPKYLLQLRSDQKHAIVVDTRKSRLYLFQNEGSRPKLVSDFYISSGKRGAQKVREGDQKTPIGVYHVTSSLPRQKLSDFYGSGAFPINYPNEWDRRMGRNGHGIWLHGTPSDTFSRPPRASDGCVVLSNSDLDNISRYLQIGLTPVIISEGVEWLASDEWDAQRNAFKDQIEAWRADWESMDMKRYLSHYSAKFSSGGQNLAQWGAHKGQVAANKTWVKVGLSNVSYFRSPGEEEVMVVTFDQDYRSNNLSNTMKKRQYWLKEKGKWRIVSEGAG